jgi:glycosyltransferase involved in cell wall biosynthesis
LKIAYVTAGAAGMFCGSCMHDNTLARALIGLGHDVALVPLYTPIRTDETDVTVDKVFFGGINVYLQQQSAFFRWLPRWMDGWLDSPTLIRWATSFGIQTEAKTLGGLAVSVLKGHDGNQQKEVDRLVNWLQDDLQPEIVLFTNVLVAGSAPEIKRRLNVPIVVTLQGDDIFLNGLVEPYKSQALAAIAALDDVVDAYLVNTEFYADAMARFLNLPRDKFRIVPLGIDTRDFTAFERSTAARPLTIGYLARIAPEKGLHLLVDAFIRLKRMPDMAETKLAIAGWLGGEHRAYAEAQFKKLRAAGFGDAFHYHGEVGREQKLDFLRAIDVLSVPTTYHEPKGLFVLEALAAGVPVVQPSHGAFPEVLGATGGGVLVKPDDSEHLADALHALLIDAPRRHLHGQRGRAAVLERFHAGAIAERTLAELQSLVAPATVTA